MSPKVRDFIYMDVDRLKSIIAQVDEGLVDSATATRGRSQEAGVGLETGVFGFLKGDAEGRFLWENEQSETRSLHDFIYNKVETALLEHQLLVRIPGDLAEAQALQGDTNGILADISFVLARGRVALNDYGRMRTIMENFNELGKFFARAGSAALPANLSHQARTKAEQDARANLSLDKEFVRGFLLVLDVFYGNRVIIKISPYSAAPSFRLVGNLNADFLRDTIDSIIYKYGTLPVSEWTVFGQVASQPPQHRTTVAGLHGGSEIEVAFQAMFDSMRELEQSAQSVVFPEIAITPIAIYRE